MSTISSSSSSSACGRDPALRLGFPARSPRHAIAAPRPSGAGRHGSHETRPAILGTAIFVIASAAVIAAVRYFTASASISVPSWSSGDGGGWSASPSFAPRKSAGRPYDREIMAEEEGPSAGLRAARRQQPCDRHVASPDGQDQLGLDQARPIGSTWRSTMERGLFDAMFIADELAPYNNWEHSSDATVKYAVQCPVHEPSTIVPIITDGDQASRQSASPYRRPSSIPIRWCDGFPASTICRSAGSPGTSLASYSKASGTPDGADMTSTVRPL